MVRLVTCMGLNRIVYQNLMRRHERRSEIRKPRRGWEDIKMDIKET
jgi:hypothetical protein